MRWCPRGRGSDRWHKCGWRRRKHRFSTPTDLGCLPPAPRMRVAVQNARSVRHENGGDGGVVLDGEHLAGNGPEVGLPNVAAVVRSSPGEPAATDARYCRWNRLLNGYSDTNAWVDKLVQDPSDAGRYESVVGFASRSAVAVSLRCERRIAVVQTRLKVSSIARCRTVR